MEVRLPEQKLNEHLLKEAAQSGDIDKLYVLIAQDPLILKRIDETPFTDTPLHIAAASKNHVVDFTLEILNLMPSYARKLNQNGATPLHLAVESKNMDVIDCLIRNDKDLVRVKGRKGMTPLFHAIMNENVDLVLKFLVACPECILDENHLSESSPCFALKNDKLKIFRLLVGWLRRSTHKDARDWEDQVLNAKDRNENTLLHIAAYKGQDWVVKELLTSKLVDISTKNDEDLTARAVAKRYRHKGISWRLWWPSLMRALILPKVPPLDKKLESNLNLWSCVNIHIQRERESISNETRDALLVVFILVATANYQASLSPPGGLWQGSANTYSSPPTIVFNNRGTMMPFMHSAEAPAPDIGGRVGTIVVATHSFRVIWWLNTVTLVISFVLILFLFPVGSRKMLLLPLCLMSVIYAMSMSIISQDDDWYMKNMYWFLPLLGLIYFASWLGPLPEMINRKFRREWRTSIISRN
ncbi:hypothetical protein ACFE04_030950 [Oxalis oulophora]